MYQWYQLIIIYPNLVTVEGHRPALLDVHGGGVLLAGNVQSGRLGSSGLVEE